MKNIINTFKKYNPHKLREDIIAGVSVATIALPQNMAYALIVGVNPIYGLYTSIVSMLVAVFVGVSNYLIVGPTNIMALAIASSLGNIEPDNYLAGIFLLTLMVGITQYLLGRFKLGNLVNYIPQPVIVGLMTGVAMVIGTGQLSKFLGLSAGNGYNMMHTLFKVVRELNHINYVSFFLGALTIIIIVVFNKYFKNMPSYLISVIISMLLVYFFGLDSQTEVVQSFSGGLPGFKLYGFDLEMIRELITPTLSIAVLGFIQVLSIIKMLEEKSGETVELNRVFQSQGIINIVCAFFQSFAISGSFTNTFANYEAGARTRISELFTGLFIMAFVVLFNSAVQYIPLASLAGIVILVAYKMIDIAAILKNFQTTTFDGLIFVITLASTVLLPRLDYAVYVGLVVSFIMVVKNTGRVNYSHIAYEEEKENSFKKKDFDEVEEDEYIIINLAGSLHFNAANNMYKELQNSFTDNKKFLLRMRDIDDIDMSTIKEIENFIEWVYREDGEVFLSGVSQEVYESLRKYGILEKIPEENVFTQKNRVFHSTKKAIEELKEDSRDRPREKS